MELRKEPIVFAVSALILGGLAWSTLSADSAGRGGQKRAEPIAIVERGAPDVATVLPTARVAKDGARDLFSPPSDTRPLPPLGLEPPPLVPLDSIAPPPVPGPASRLWGRNLRVPARTVAVPDLFDVADEIADEGGGAETQPASAAKTGALAPEEVAARLAAWKRTYDWFRVGEIRFGQIKNPDRYRLAKRPNEDVLFVEFDPERGAPRFPGQAPAKIPRANVTEFGFAATIPNEIEQRRVEFGDPLSASEYDAALAYARWCIDQRMETPRALEVAAEIYTRASQVLQEDPQPKLGLARVHEAAFRFEDAFQIYRALLDGPMKGNPLVLVRLAELQARFRLDSEAEANLRDAERHGRTSWIVQEAVARFALAHGDAAKAVEHYRLANQFEPTGEEKRDRARLRAGLGAALLATGDLAGAGEWFEKALQADATSDEARVGLASLRTLRNDAASAASTDVGTESKSFDLLLATGVEMARKPSAESARAARSALVAAANLDPLRASLAHRALSWLAEATGHPDEALRHVDLAIEGDPADAWSHFQRGRLLVARDDLDGARDALHTALSLDVEFADALAWLGDVAHRRGDLAAADKFLERALAIDPTLVRAGVLRGVALLEAGSVAEADQVLKKAVAKDLEEPAARGASAWVQYRLGDPTESLTRLAELDDARRTLGEDDPWRLWARRQIERITDHLEKVAWSDGFERTDLVQGYSVQESSGPLVSIHDGVVSIRGTFKAQGRTRFWKTYNAADVVSIQAKLVVRAGTSARVGLFMSRESERGGETQVEAEATVSRHPDAAKNAVQFRAMKRGEEELAYVEVPGTEWAVDQTVVLRIERVGESGDARVRASLDGIPVAPDTPLSALGRTTNPLRLGVFAEGAPGRAVQLDVDDVEIVVRQKVR